MPSRQSSQVGLNALRQITQSILGKRCVRDIEWR